ncbi:MAG: tyrosine-protein phosphatase [Chloroflexi bacterium]|nr:tyrosine-protein phosphatase [Chloroflexota bacterium]
MLSPFLMFVIFVGGLMLLLALLLTGVLIWQATVRPYTYDELFVLPDEDLLPMETDTGSPRIIPMEGTTNFRDLGGYTTPDGSRMAWRQLFRSARWLQLTGEDIERIEALGIRTVVDFRQSADAEEFPNRLPDDIDYQSIPVFEDTPMSPRRVAFNRHRLLDVFAGVYVNHIVERGAPTFGRLMKLLTDPDNLPLVFHCTAGKDRTGIAAALILSAVGVPRDVVVNDYLLTNLAAESFIEEINTQLGARNVRGVATEQLYPLLAASPRLIMGALDHIDARYGTVEAYLLEKAGLTKADLSRMRTVLLEPMPEPASAVPS